MRDFRTRSKEVEQDQENALKQFHKRTTVSVHARGGNAEARIGYIRSHVNDLSSSEWKSPILNDVKRGKSRISFALNEREVLTSALQANSSHAAVVATVFGYGPGFEGWDHYKAGYITDYIIGFICIVCMAVLLRHGVSPSAWWHVSLQFYLCLLFTCFTYLMQGIAHNILDGYYQNGQTMGTKFSAGNSVWIYFWLAGMVTAPFADASYICLALAFSFFPRRLGYVAYILGAGAAIFELVVLIMGLLFLSGIWLVWVDLVRCLTAIFLFSRARGSFSRLFAMLGAFFELLGVGFVLFAPASCRKERPERAGCFYPQEFNQNAWYHSFVIVSIIFISHGVARKATVNSDESSTPLLVGDAEHARVLANVTQRVKERRALREEEEEAEANANEDVFISGIFQEGSAKHVREIEVGDKDSPVVDSEAYLDGSSASVGVREQQTHRDRHTNPTYRSWDLPDDDDNDDDDALKEQRKQTPKSSPAHVPGKLGHLVAGAELDDIPAVVAGLSDEQRRAITEALANSDRARSEEKSVAKATSETPQVVGQHQESAVTEKSIDEPNLVEPASKDVKPNAVKSKWKLRSLLPKWKSTPKSDLALESEAAKHLSGDNQPLDTTVTQAVDAGTKSEVAAISEQQKPSENVTVDAVGSAVRESGTKARASVVNAASNPAEKREEDEKRGNILDPTVTNVIETKLDTVDKAERGNDNDGKVDVEGIAESSLGGEIVQKEEKEMVTSGAKMDVEEHLADQGSADTSIARDEPGDLTQPGSPPNIAIIQDKEVADRLEENKLLIEGAEDSAPVASAEEHADKKVFQTEVAEDHAVSDVYVEKVANVEKEGVEKEGAQDSAPVANAEEHADKKVFQTEVAEDHAVSNVNAENVANVEKEGVEKEGGEEHVGSHPVLESNEAVAQIEEHAEQDNSRLEVEDRHSVANANPPATAPVESSIPVGGIVYH